MTAELAALQAKLTADETRIAGLEAQNTELRMALRASLFELQDRRCIAPRLDSAIAAARAVLARPQGVAA